MNFNPPEVLAGRLEKRERLIWWGRPKQGIIFRRADIFVISFFVLWCSFAYSSGSILLPLIGQCVLIGWFSVDAWSRRQTYYGLTPTRLLIAEPFKIRSVELENLDEITLEEYSDRTGTIILGREPHGRDLINYGGAFRTGTNILSRELYGRDQNDDDGALLERISDAQRVYTEIRAQRN